MALPKINQHDMFAPFLADNEISLHTPRSTGIISVKEKSEKHVNYLTT